MKKDKKKPGKKKEEDETTTVAEIELESLRKESAEYKEKYLLTLADAENARKRLIKERDGIVRYAIENVILDFLHPIDHMENALKFTEEASDEVKHWATGFNMIMHQLKDVLANNGVVPITAKDQEFDPHLHEAVEMIVTDKCPPGIVVDEQSRGYRIGERVLRPSRVVVSKAPKEKEAQKDEEKVTE